MKKKCEYWKRQEMIDADDKIGGEFLSVDDPIHTEREKEDENDPPCGECEWCLESQKDSQEVTGTCTKCGVTTGSQNGQHFTDNETLCDTCFKAKTRKFKLHTSLSSSSLWLGGWKPAIPDRDVYRETTQKALRLEVQKLLGEQTLSNKDGLEHGKVMIVSWDGYLKKWTRE